MDGPQIVLLGKTGSGKSASGNTIIGGNQKPFEEGFSPASVTKTCKLEQTEVNGKKITVIDTVGLSDTPATVHVQTEIEKIFKYAPNGIDVFLLVIRLGESLKGNDKNHVTWIQKNFGAKVLESTILLFTHADRLPNQPDNQNQEEKVKEYIRKSEFLYSVVQQCLERYHVFNNKHQDPSQVTELLEKIHSLSVKKGYNRYTEQDYAETQKELLYRKCYTKAAKGGAAIGGAAGAVGGAIGVKIGAVALTAGKLAAAGAAGAAGGAVLLGGVVFAGVYFFARKYYPSNK